MFSLSNWEHLLASVCSVIAILLLTSIAMNDSNRTTKESLPSSETLAIVQVTFYTAITIFGTTANLALCGTMIRKNQPRNASEYLILNLAFTDLMTCAVGIPLDVAVILSQRWPFGAFMCKVVWPFQTVLIAVSVGTLTCMAIERYRAILTTFKTMLSQNVVKIVICAVWCLSVVLVAPYPGGRGTSVFFGWICAARDSKLAPRSKKNFP